VFDIGVNLTSGQLLPDIAEVLQRATQAGVTGLAITGTSLSESQQAADLCVQYSNEFPGILCSTAGVHPHQASEWTREGAAQIRALAALPSTLAIGETGLDFNRNFSTPEAQKLAFSAQLEIAGETGLPLFLHERDAFDTQIGMLREHRKNFTTAVTHCFTGTRAQLDAYLDLDFYIGITGWVCDERRGKELAEIVKYIPLERLLIETDAPWLLPRNMHPKPENRRNEPAYLGWISRELALRYDLSELLIREQTFRNALDFFRIPYETPARKSPS
jgi:TatD DNase family protein